MKTPMLFALMFLFAAPSFAQESTTTLPPLNWSGDLRYRMVQTKEGGDEARFYNQLRARIGFTANAAPDLVARIRLATASSAISTNQTLGDSADPGFVRRSFGVDLAAMEWQALPELQVQGGRVLNPFFSPNKSQLVYDSDLNFEGLALKAVKEYEGSQVFINVGAFTISENYDSTNKVDTVDTGILGAQLGGKIEALGWKFAGHLSTQQFVNIQDQSMLSLDKGAKLDGASAPFNRYRGNRVYLVGPAAAGKYVMQNKFTLQEIGLEAKTKIDPVELTLFGDFVKNTGADDQNSAYEAGFSAKWERTTLTYAHIRKEADSVIGTFTDSDANGGGTDNEGDRVSVGYQFSKNSGFAVNHFMAKRGIDSTNRDLRLTQLDFMMQF